MIIEELTIGLLFGIVLTWIFIYVYGLQIIHQWRKELKAGDRVVVSNSKTQAWKGNIYYIDHEIDMAIISGEEGFKHVKIKHLWKPSSL